MPLPPQLPGCHLEILKEDFQSYSFQPACNKSYKRCFYGNADRALHNVAAFIDGESGPLSRKGRPPAGVSGGGGPGCDILELLGTQTQSRNQLSVTPSRWGEKHRHPIDTRLPVDSGVFNDGLSVSAHF